MIPQLSRASALVLENKNKPKATVDHKLNTQETFKALGSLEKILSLKSRGKSTTTRRGTLKLLKNSPELRKGLVTERSAVGRNSIYSKPSYGGVPSSDDSSISSMDSERVERLSVDETGRPIKRRMTSSAFKIADFTGIPAPDA